LYVPAADATANTFNNLYCYIPNYASSSQKSVILDISQEDNQAEAYNQLYANLWTGTSAITSMRFTEQNGFNIVQYSSATLYGIKNSSGKENNAN
jgi:hypothetical protein